MRKTVVYLFILSFICSFTGNSSAEPQTSQAVISGIQGNPSVVRDNQTLPASAGMVCQKNDVLKTTANCALDISLNGLAGCRLLASSEGILTETDSGNMQVTVTSGNAILNLKKLPKNSTFRVETPTAIAAVRGTQFWGRVDLQNPKNPVTTFAVRQGAVEIFTKATGLTLTIKEGQALDIPKDPSVVPSLRPALAEELKAMEQADAIRTSA